MNTHSLARTSPRSRVLLARRICRDGWSVEEAAAAQGISTKTARKWVARYREAGSDPDFLPDASSRPWSSPARTPADRGELVIQLRRQRMAGAKIAVQLRMRRSTVYRILKRADLSRLKVLDDAPPPVRYEHRRPGDLLHIDVKKLGRIGRPGHRVNGDRTTRTRGIGWEFAHVCIDDHSRLAYVEVLSDEQGPTCTGFLRRAIDWYERQGIRVRRVMTDNGSAYRWNSGLFHRLLEARRIKHLRTQPYRPQTNGKAERFIQTLMREWAYASMYTSSRHRLSVLPTWLRYYNRRRPHAALDGRPPSSRIIRPGEQRA